MNEYECFQCHTWSHHLCEGGPLAIPGDPGHSVPLDRALSGAPPHSHAVVFYRHHLHFGGRVDA